MSLAAEAREAVRRHPFLLAGLRAGVVNYTAAARFLDVEGDDDAVATALRRYAEELPALDPQRRDARVTMESDLGLAGPDEGGHAVGGGNDREGDGGDRVDEGAVLAVGGAAVVPDAGSLTGVLAEGEVDAAALSAVLGRLLAADLGVAAAGVAGDALLVVVGRRDGATALRIVEDVLDGAVPSGRVSRDSSRGDTPPRSPCCTRSNSSDSA